VNRFITRRRALAGLGAAAALAAVPAVSRLAGSAEPRRVTIPNLATDSGSQVTRSYQMGFFFLSPRSDIPTVLQTIDDQKPVTEVLLIQREVPYSRLLGGQSIKQAYDEEYKELIAHIRSKGITPLFLVDPLDGLNRRQEGNEIRKNGRSLREPAMRTLHRDWTLYLAEQVQAPVFGLASEINTLGAHGDPGLYAIVKDLINGLAPEVRRVSPGTKVSMTFQVDDAWGKFGLPGDVDQFVMTREFDMDILGLSSYPSFVFQDPAEIPIDYFRRLQLAANKPAWMAEGGWASVSNTAGVVRNEQLQANYYRKTFELLDSVEAEYAVFLEYADLDLTDPGLVAVLAPDQIATLVNFASMGIVDTQFRRKLSHAAWTERFKVPRRTG
jgi:hypothetical protein